MYFLVYIVSCLLSTSYISLRIVVRIFNIQNIQKLAAILDLLTNLRGKLLMDEILRFRELLRRHEYHAKMRAAIDSVSNMNKTDPDENTIAILKEVKSQSDVRRLLRGIQAQHLTRSSPTTLARDSEYPTGTFGCFRGHHS